MSLILLGLFAQTLTRDESDLLKKYGWEGTEFVVSYTSLKDEVKSFYGDSLAHHLKQSEEAEIANAGKLGKLDIGRVLKSKRLRVITVREPLYLPGNTNVFVEGASYQPSPFSREFGFKPVTIMSERGKYYQHTLRHELTHSSLEWNGQEYAEVAIYMPVRLSDLEYSYYKLLVSPKEIDPRLAEVKRGFVKHTGKNCCTMNECGLAWEWARQNPNKINWLYGSQIENGNSKWLEAVEKSCLSRKTINHENLFRRMAELL